MPQAVSRKQYRMMMAVLHGKGGDSGSSRGRPPKSVAAKYTDPGKDAPEQSGQDRGGSWDEKHHAKDRERVKAGRKERRHKKKEEKKHLKKAFTDFYKGQAAATLVVDANENILLGQHESGGWAFPGGHVDAGESYEQAALRELREEAGVVGRLSDKIYTGKENGNDVVVYLAEIATGRVKSTNELKNIKWFAPQDIPWNNLRNCCQRPLEQFVTNKLGKSLKQMLAVENLQKNIIREGAGDHVLEVTHGDSLRLVGNGLFRKLRDEVKTMTDEDFKDFTLDTYTVSIRKHINDIYSGRVVDGHKVVYQFTNKSLPELTAALMSVFEWYLPEDEAVLDMVDDTMSDDVIHGGINELVENYKRHNIGNIYSEMETIREQMRNGVAVDLQQVEGRIMGLFDKLEEVMHELVGKHNTLANKAGEELDVLEAKLRELQSKIETMEKKPQTIEAFSSAPANPHRVHSDGYPYLPKPQIEIEPSGKIKITFAQEWTPLEKENFLQDMRAKVIKASKSND